MAKKRRRRTETEQRAYDERTRMIEDYIARLRARVAARQAEPRELGSS